MRFLAWNKFVKLVNYNAYINGSNSLFCTY